MKGQWRALDLEGRKAWSIAASKRFFAKGGVAPIPRPSEFVLDGEIIDDLLGFLCAMGEAVNGPGGYFGCDMTTFDDCLFGSFGLEAPCTIRWLHSARSRECLGSKALIAWCQSQLGLTAAGKPLGELVVELGPRELGSQLASFISSIGADVPLDDFTAGQRVVLATLQLAERGERTLFDEIIETIKSTRDRCGWRRDWIITVRLE